MEKQGIKLTPLPFLIKAVGSRRWSRTYFNVSLMADGEVCPERYVHMVFAVDFTVGLWFSVCVILTRSQWGFQDSLKKQTVN